jgi:hypothetical protein
MTVVLAAACTLTACSSSSRHSTTAHPTTTAPTTAVPTTVAPTPTAVDARLANPGPPHTMLIVLENREYGDVVGSPHAPFITDLARRYGSATNLFAATHPSLPNYLELLTGRTFGISSDCTSCSVDGDTLVDQLDRQGTAWAAFMEGMPSPCFTGANAGSIYAKKHDPFMYVRHLAANPVACAKVQPMTELDAALSAPSPPAFIWVTPNMCDDGHDCALATADGWLRGQLGRIQASPWYGDGGVVIVTWDEGTSAAGCCGHARGGHIATLVVGNRVKPGSHVDTPVSHAGILATIEDRYGVDRLGDAACPCSGTLASLLD